VISPEMPFNSLKQNKKKSSEFFGALFL